MRDALRQLQEVEQAQAKVIDDAKIQTALTWWNTIKPTIPATRQEALDVYDFIKGLIETETDRFRLAVLRKKLDEANEKFKEIKRNV